MEFANRCIYMHAVANIRSVFVYYKDTLYDRLGVKKMIAAHVFPISLLPKTQG